MDRLNTSLKCKLNIRIMFPKHVVHADIIVKKSYLVCSHLERGSLAVNEA